MDPKELFAKALQQATSCVIRVREKDLANATPCTDWDLKTLINHMVYELLWIPDLLKGKTVAQVGDRYDGDVLRSDFENAWQHAADAALMAVKHAELGAIVHLSYGDEPAHEYIAEMSAEMLIHGWDVGQSLQYSLRFEPSIAQVLYDTNAAHQERLETSSYYAGPLDVEDEADLSTKLLALFGRRNEAVADGAD